MREAAETRPRPERDAAPVGRAAGYGLLCIVVFFWGVNWPLMKIGLTWISPFWFSFLRIAIASASLFVVVAALGQLRFPGRRDWPIVLTIGFVQVGAFVALVHFGVKFVDAGRAAILAYTTPIWVTPVAILVLGERLTRRKAAGVAFGLAGLAVLFNPLGFDWSDPDVVLGNFMLLGGSMCWALGMLHVKAHRLELTSLQLGPWQLLLGTLPSLVLALTLESPAAIDWNPELVAILVFNGTLATALPFWALITLNRALPAISTSLGVLGVPALGLIASIVLLGEAVTVDLVAGLVLILAGVGLVAIADQRR